MNVCRQCGVELEDHMDICPLCDTPVAEGKTFSIARESDKSARPPREKKRVMRQVLWQITSVLLLSAVAATLVINLAIQRVVSWSVYPVSICLMLFAYTSLMALWRTTLALQMIAGWAASAGILFLVKTFSGADWTLGLALPILCAANAIGLLLYFFLRRGRLKGLSILAIIFIGIVIFCLTLEGILSFYFDERIRLQWSVVVSACMLPVVVAILFMHWRTRSNTELQKIFHT